MEALQVELDPLGLFSKGNDELGESAREPTPLVGDDRLEEFESRRHMLPMLSLDNTYDEAEFLEFDARLRRMFGADSWPYVVEPKIDGVAVSLTYEMVFFDLR